MAMKTLLNSFRYSTLHSRHVFVLGIAFINDYTTCVGGKLLDVDLYMLSCLFIMSCQEEENRLAAAAFRIQAPSPSGDKHQAFGHQLRSCCQKTLNVGLTSSIDLAHRTGSKENLVG